MKLAAMSFEQQPMESAKAFAAFSVYLSLGEQRSLDAAGKKIGKSTTLMERWSRKFDWPARVRAHASHMAVVERETTEALVRGKAATWLARKEQVKEEEWEIHDECIRAGREALKRFYERGRGATLGDIARVLELASKLGRLATGLATEKTEVSGEDGGPIRVEVELALKKIYGQAELGTTVETQRRRDAEVVDVEEIGNAESGEQKSDQSLLTSAATGGQG